jgi:mannosyltransferase
MIDGHNVGGRGRRVSTQTEQGERRKVSPHARTDQFRPARRVAGGRWSRATVRAPLAIGLLAAVISAVGSGNASFWGDEAASVMSAERSIPNLFALLANIDAVHGSYYLFLHFWTGLVGTGEFAVRLPSAVAVGVAAAGTVLLGRQLLGGRAAIAAGLLFAVIPQVTMMGQEARSYAFGMAAAVWLTNWLVAIVRRGDLRPRTWALFGVAVAACLYLFLYLALLALVHVAVFVAFAPGVRMWRAWARSLLLAALLAAPVLFFGLAQRGQIGFLARRNYATLESALVGQWFGSPFFAVAAWALVVVGLVAAIRSGRRAALVLGVWVFAPTALLFLGNALVTPMYNLRYVAFCTPAVALLMGFGVTALAGLVRLRRRPAGAVSAAAAAAAAPAAASSWPRSAVTSRRGDTTRWMLPALAILLVAALAAPVYLAQRGPYGKDGGSDLRQVADAIERNASPGDAVVFAEDIKPSQKPRLSIDLYPDRFAGLADVALVTPFTSRDQLWDVVRPLPEVAPALLEHDTVWAVEREGRSLEDIAELQRLGFSPRQMIQVNRSVIYRMVRTPAELP